MEAVFRAIEDEAARLAEDRVSGASELIERAVELLERAVAAAGTPADDASRRRLGTAARAVALAQPSMGAFWNAAAVALSPSPGGGGPGLRRLRQRVARAPRALARVAAATLGGSGARDRPLRIATCSYSGSVLAALAALAEVERLEVWCGEGRPAMEGRRLASALVARGLPTRFSTDAGVALAIEWADALLLGADALTGDRWVNKAGSGPLAAAAGACGVPVLVVASREKFVPAPLASCLHVVDRPPGEVWAEAPPGLAIVNRDFERVPLSWVTTLVTDAGACDPDAASEICRANGRDLPGDAVALLLAR